MRNRFESDEAELTKTNPVKNPLNEFRRNRGICTTQGADRDMTNEDYERSEDHLNICTRIYMAYYMVGYSTVFLPMLGLRSLPGSVALFFSSQIFNV